MTDESSDNLIDALAEDFVARYRIGERPALTEYVKRHPELGGEIRELFPALVMLEQARSQEDGAAIRDESFADSGSAPRVLGEFRILREVGRGGMGIVYEAIQQSLNRHVALKVLPVRFGSDERLRERFQREARAAGRLHHPNIVPVFAVGDVDGQPFYAMQFIQGLGLDQIAREVRRLRFEKQATSTAADRFSGPEPIARPEDAARAIQSTKLNLAHGLLTGVFRLSDPEDSALQSDEGQRPVDANLRTAEPDRRLSDRDLVAKSGRNGNSLSSSATGRSSSERESQFSATIHESGRAYWRSVSGIGAQIADAVQYAADQGVLHRDIKPANLLMDLKGNVWITDFGLAKSDENEELTNPGDIIGTLRYLAPERLQGRSDLRSDVYSIGVTLYELLVLRPAFEGVKRDQLLSLISDVDPVRPRLIDASIPADLETIVLKAMAKDGFDRYATAAELADDLRRFLDDRPIRARRVGPAEQAWRWCRRNQLLTGLLSITAVLTMALLVGWWVSVAVRSERDRALKNQARAERAEGDANQQRLRAESAERESRIRAHLAQANVFRRSGSEGQQFGCLNEIAAAMKLQPSDELREELRDTAIAALGLTDVRPVSEHPVDGEVWGSVSHNQKWLAQVPSNIETLRIVDVETGQALIEHAAPAVDYYFADLEFSSDDRYLFVLYLIHTSPESLLRIVDMESSEVVAELAVRSVEFGVRADVHPDGTMLGYLDPQDNLVFFDLDLLRVQRRLPMASGCFDIEFLPDGQRFVCLEGTNTTVVRDSESGSELFRLPTESVHQGSVMTMALSHDGVLLALGDRIGGISVWNLESREMMSELPGHSGGITHFEFAASGYMLVTQSWDSTTRLWDSSSGRCLMTSERWMRGFSKDGRRIGFYGPDATGSFELSRDDLISQLPDPTFGNKSAASEAPGIYFASANPDRSILAAFGNAGVAFWDMERRQRLMSMDVGFCRDCQFRDDNRMLAMATEDGAYLWPMNTTDNEQSRELVVGPPRKLLPEMPMDAWDVCWLAMNKLAISDRMNNRVLLVDLEPETPGVEYYAMTREQVTGGMRASADGRWLGLGALWSQEFCVFDLELLNRQVVPLDTKGVNSNLNVGFSHDGQWMAVSATTAPGEGGFHLFHTGSWERTRFFPSSFQSGRPVFSADSSMLAQIPAPYALRLLDVKSGRTLSTIDLPELRASPPLAFRDNDSELILTQNNRIVVWDLAKISQELDRMGFSWLDREFDRTDEPRSESPRSIRIDYGDFLDQRRQRENLTEGNRLRELALAANRRQDFASAQSNYAKAMELLPDDVLLWNNYAWALIAPRDTSVENAALALQLSQRAVERTANHAIYLNTLGVAQFRNGLFDACLTTLQHAEDLSPDTAFAFNGYFIAMACEKLGRNDEARDWLDRAVKWHEAKAQTDPELALFREEAMSVISRE